MGRRSSASSGANNVIDKVSQMKSISLKQFRNNFKAFVDKVLTRQIPLKVKSQSGKEIVLISFSEWEREQETLYVLQNKNLMQQIAQSKITHGRELNR